MNNKLVVVFSLAAMLFSLEIYSQESHDIPRGNQHAGGGIDNTGINAAKKIKESDIYNPPINESIFNIEKHESDSNDGGTSDGGTGDGGTGDGAACDPNQQSCEEESSAGECDPNEQSCEQESTAGECDHNEQSCQNNEKPNPMAEDIPEMTDDEIAEERRKKRELITGPVRKYEQIDIGSLNGSISPRNSNLIRTLPGGISTVELNGENIRRRATECDLANPESNRGCNSVSD